jgi:sugar O-acyltransferase (sialic acid O-acetyltransferase NeuD family)
MTTDDALEPCPVLVVGGGGHATVLIDALSLTGRRVLGFTELRDGAPAARASDRLGGDEAVLEFEPSAVGLVNGVGSAGSTLARREVFERFSQRGYHFVSVIHPSAVLSPGVRLEEGVQIMAGAVVQTGARIGANVIINTRASVDHDCDIQRHAHVAPGALLCGHVRVGSGAHVGAGAVVIQGVAIGDGAIVGAGAVVVDDVPPQSTVVGIPAREIRRPVRG